MPVASFSPPPLHWAADLGLDRLVARLIEKGADVNRKDTKYNSPPVGWALYGRYDSPPGSRGRHREVVALLVSAGAKVEPKWLLDEQVCGDPAMLAVLGGARGTSSTGTLHIDESRGAGWPRWNKEP